MLRFIKAPESTTLLQPRGRGEGICEPQELNDSLGGRQVIHTCVQVLILFFPLQLQQAHLLNLYFLKGEMWTLMMRRK